MFCLNSIYLFLLLYMYNVIDTIINKLLFYHNKTWRVIKIVLNRKVFKFYTQTIINLSINIKTKMLLKSKLKEHHGA